MSGFDSRDRLPMAAAVLVIVVGNAISYTLDLTLYLTILVAPVAIAAFAGVRYLLHGEAIPDGFRIE